MVHGIKEKDGSVFKLVVIYKKIFVYNKQNLVNIFDWFDSKLSANCLIDGIYSRLVVCLYVCNFRIVDNRTSR